MGEGLEAEPSADADWDDTEMAKLGLPVHFGASRPQKKASSQGKKKKKLIRFTKSDVEDNFVPLISGARCYARYSADGLWYPAEINEISIEDDAPMFHVTFEYYGNSEIVSSDSVCEEDLFLKSHMTNLISGQPLHENSGSFAADACPNEPRWTIGDSVYYWRIAGPVPPKENVATSKTIPKGTMFGGLDTKDIDAGDGLFTEGEHDGDDQSPRKESDPEPHGHWVLGIVQGWASDGQVYRIRIKDSELVEMVPRQLLRDADSGMQLTKYWAQRYRLFSKFDEGILLDDESWFSVTPEAIAKHTAERCATAGARVIVDACVGPGGNAIQFARACDLVVAFDIDQKKIDCARNNARVYDVAQKIEFVLGDFSQQICSVAGCVVFLSPPWGGPKYLKNDTFSLYDFTVGDYDGVQLYYEVQRHVTPNIVYFLPRNTDATELQLLSQGKLPYVATGEMGKQGFRPRHVPMEVEANFMNGKKKALTVYFGPLFQPVD
eukprot:Rmarinus@m.22969